LFISVLSADARIRERFDIVNGSLAEAYFILVRGSLYFRPGE
jgi:hypothetical protein